MDDQATPDSRVETGKRAFHWGPPVFSPAERASEWSVYALLVLLLGGMGFFILDFSHAVKSPFLLDRSSASDSSDVARQINQGEAISDVPRETGTGFSHKKETGPLFFVQLGLFGDEDSARKYLETIRKEGYNPTLQPPDDRIEMYRLVLGPFATEHQAESISRKLNELEFPSFVLESR